MVPPAPHSSISRSVIVMNGRAASPVTASSSPSGHSGAGISSAETNCEETAASIRAAPQRQKAEQKAHRGARTAGVQVSAAGRNGATAPIHDDLRGRLIDLELEA